MTKQLDQRWVCHMQRLPETGMGYHLTRIRFANGREIGACIIRNCSEAIVPNDCVDADIINIVPEVTR